MKIVVALFLSLLIATVAIWDGALAAGSAPPYDARHVEVLVYHAFGSPAAYTISPRTFADQLLYLQRHRYTVLSQKQFIGFLAGTYRPRGPSVLLTFDDGPESFYRIAYPLLVRFHDHAVAFLIGSRIGEKGTVSAAQVRAMARSGLVAFGAHTYRLHSFVHGRPALSDAQPQAVMADERLEDAVFRRLGLAPPQLFAYPFGYHTRVLDRLLLRRYRALFTSQEALAQSGMRVIPRVNVGSNYASMCRIPAFLASTSPAPRGQLWYRTALLNVWGAYGGLAARVAASIGARWSRLCLLGS